MRAHKRADDIGMRRDARSVHLDRRAGVRQPVAGLEIELGDPARRRFGHRRARLKARVLNVSRHGLLVLARDSRELVVGNRLPIEMCGGQGVVEIRYVRPSARRAWRLCGVDLVTMDRQLQTAILEMTSLGASAYARPWASIR